jgi:hypothetical protein
MDVEHLRSKGWTPAEIAHAIRIAKAHPVTAHEQGHLWLLVLLLGTGSIGVGLALAPIGAFLPAWFGAVAGALLGILFGSTLSHSLGSLRIVQAHHVRATLILAAMSFLLLTTTLWVVLERLSALPFAHTQSPLFIAVPYVLGLLLPYVIDRRLHGSA